MNPRPRRRRVGSCLAALAVVGLRVSTAGASAADNPPDNPPIFAVDIAARPDEAEAFEAVLRDAISGQPVSLATVVVARIDPGNMVRAPGSALTRPVLGRAFVDLSEPQRATVYVVDGDWQRISVRNVTRTANPDVVRETVGRMVSTSVEALLAGSFAAASEPMAAFQSALDQAQRDQAPKPPPAAPPAAAVVMRAPPAPTSPAVPRIAARLGLTYEVDLYSAARPLVHGPSLYGALALGTARVRPALWLSGQYRFPVEESGPPLGFRLDSTVLRLMAGAEVHLRERLALEVGAGLGLDFINVKAQAPASQTDVWVAHDRSFQVGLGRLMVGLRWRTSASTAVHASFVADIDPSGTRLVFEGAQGEQEILSLYGVRPGLALALSVL
ncbi:MAG TPA: hypothetical protein VNO55_31235 [Polyangia bacterium]|nr:hypothetical protein [Polyangia bacterium]